MWWDEETDVEVMYPREEKHLTAEQFIASLMKNPDEIAARGNWSDPDFLANLNELNPQLKHTYFADFHSHGWVFRAVFKKDRKGNLLDYNGKPIEHAKAADLKRGVDMPQQIMQQSRNGASAKKSQAQHHQEEAP